MSAREEILTKIEVALKASRHPQNIDVPREYRMEGDDAPGSEPVVAEMVEKLEDYTAKVIRTDAAGIPDAIDEFLADATTVVVPTGLDEAWKKAAARGGRTVNEDSREKAQSHMELDATDAVVTASRVAISLSGTIILDGEPDQGRRAITLVPDTHIIVLHEHDIYPTVPQAVAVLDENPTRPITWIAGPSATSDIEMVRVDGVHGPRNLRVVIVRD